MKEEMLIEVDENDRKIGIQPRSSFRGELIHRSVHLMLFNSNNEILLQKRAPTKTKYPNLYTFSVSGAVSIESYEKAMKREMKEELSISVPFKKLFKWKYFDKIDKSFRTIYIAQSDKQVKVDKNEACGIKWISLKDFKKELKENADIYTPPLRKAMEMYFSKYGTNLPNNL